MGMGRKRRMVKREKRVNREGRRGSAVRRVFFRFFSDVWRSSDGVAMVCG